eukprot:15202668-Heterocapsa_arctica.AAC.1
MIVNWLRQTEGGVHTSTSDNWEEYDVHSGQVRGHELFQKDRQATGLDEYQSYEHHRSQRT